MRLWLFFVLLSVSVHAEEVLKGPSEADFLHEIFDAAPTDKTADFHDQNDGYHAEKNALSKALRAEAERTGRKLRAFLIGGPGSIMWSYQITVFFEEGKDIRVNHLTFPHARITYKSTGLIKVEKFDAFVEAMSTLPESKKPAGVGENAERVWFAWNKAGQKGFQMVRNSLTDDDAGVAFEKAYNALLLELTETYPKKPE